MTKRLLTIAIATLFFAGLTFAAGANGQKSSKEGTYVGVITDTHCGAKGHMGPAAECVKKCVSMGAKYALASEGKVYVLEPQSMAAKHPGGSHVRVMGTLEGNTIHATSITAVNTK
jgi:hypothetical protein